MRELPQGWVEIPLADAINVSTDRASPADLGAMPFIGLEHVEGYTGKLGETSDTSTVKSNVVLFQRGDTLFGRLRPYLRKIVNVDFAGAASSEFIVFRQSGAIDNRFLGYLLRSDNFIEFANEKCTGDRPRVSAAALGEFRLWLPPLAEQKRIVTNVDNLLARIAGAREKLQHVQAQVENFRTRILRAAFNGNLTAAYRGTPAGSMKGGGNLPEGWSVKPLNEIAAVQGGIQVGKKRPSSAILVEVPYLRVANVQRGSLDLTEIKTISVTQLEKDRLLLQHGDVLMNEGGDRDKLGRGWVWENQLSECIHQNHVFRIRLRKNSLPPKFLSYYANENGQSYFFDKGTQTTNLASISKHKVEVLPVVVPPFDEAIEIVNRLELAFDRINNSTREQALATEMLNRLEQQIFAKAFRGELVPQDPNDEPAQALLDLAKATRDDVKLAPLVERLASVAISPDRSPRKSRTTAMPKTRTDDDVWHQPYLAELLRLEVRIDEVDRPVELGIENTAPRTPEAIAQALFKKSDLEVADFYKQLAWEIEAGHIVEVAGRLRAA